ncbi:MAG: alpha/beta fold hydrolase [Rhodobacteraceae bacterium]|nr:alpha/beta fold hydrolase [Paracoccaceae bacterium]
MKILRTDESRFADLPDFPWLPNYVEDLPGYDKLRIHYVDEGAGNPDQPVFLCLHGEPTWSYLFRRMIPEFLKAGGRVIAPDLPGFGRSDKPVDDAIYGFHFHRNLLVELIRRLDLENITLVVQDWGGLLGLTLPPDMPERFDRLIIMNTVLATGQPAGQGFAQWRDYVAANPDLAVGKLMHRSCPHLRPAEVAAYDAPFPDRDYKAGVRRFPAMVMTDPAMEGVKTSKRALEFWRNDWHGKTFMAVGALDPVLGEGIMRYMQKNIKGCPEPLILPHVGHFVQEWGDTVAKAALTHFDD